MVMESSLILRSIWSDILVEWFKPFHQTKAWRNLARKHKLLAKSKGMYYCVKCGTTEELESDHILSVIRYPKLRLKMVNLQLLCREHNRKKGAKVLFGLNTFKLLFLLWLREAFFTAFLVGLFFISVYWLPALIYQTPIFARLFFSLID